MWRNAREFALAALLGTGVACAGATISPRTGELRIVSVAAASRRTPTEFHARIGRQGSPGAGERSDAGLSASVSLRLRDDAFEYQINLQNPGALQVTEAVVVTRADPAGPLTSVLVLFRDARFRDRFLEIRGLGVVLPSMSPAGIAEEIQGRPSAFAVMLSGPGGERWLAPLSEGR